MKSPILAMLTRERFAKAALGGGLGASLLFFAGSSLAEEPTELEAVAPPSAPKPFAYSIPWQLRPAAVPNVIRSDNTFAFYEDPASGDSGVTVAAMFLGALNLGPELGAMVRLGLVQNSPPGAAESGMALVNPAVGITYLKQFDGGLKVGAFLGLAAPVGMGGGEEPDPGTAAAAASGVVARSAMDNAMFAVNYFTVFPGVTLAYVANGLTLQLEATVLQLSKTRGPDALDSSVTNFTSGFHVGYFVVPQLLSLGGELRYQRFFDNESPAGPGAVVEDTPLVDNWTFAVGPRGHFRVSDSAWFRPGIAYSRGLDDPMSQRNYNMLQVDLLLML